MKKTAGTESLSYLGKKAYEKAGVKKKGRNVAKYDEKKTLFESTTQRGVSKLILK